MDAFDVMVHIFTPETRARYRLEQLWRDGEDVPVTPLLGAAKGSPRPEGSRPKAKTARPRVTKAKAVKKTPRKKKAAGSGELYLQRLSKCEKIVEAEFGIPRTT